MAYKIGQAQKLVKKKKLPDITTDTYSAPSNPSNSHEKLNKNTDIKSKKSINADNHYSTTTALENKPAEIIQTDPVDFKYFC